jgi:Multicopper oxidase
MAPDGVEKQMLVYNNQFPGPLIEANWGDTLVIHVQNNLQDNGYVFAYFTDHQYLHPLARNFDGAQCRERRCSWCYSMYLLTELI